MENRCAQVLNLVPEFDERTIRDESSWRDSLLPKLREFLLNVPSEDGRIRLAIEAHATLAFAAGAVLDAKSGRLTELEQRSPVMKIWAPDDDTLSLSLIHIFRCVDVLIGGQYGSEGKGNIVAYLAREYDVMIRVGGPNAGHTVASAAGTFTYHHLPSGSRDVTARLLLGPRCV